MGYCVPAAIAAKLAHPDRQVLAIVGDGAFLMTCVELVTATDLQLPLIVFVFNDGELGQISQFQRIPLNRKTCAVVGQLDYEGMAQATGCAFVQIANDLELEEKMDQAFSLGSQGRPVIVGGKDRLLEEDDAHQRRRQGQPEALSFRRKSAVPVASVEEACIGMMVGLEQPDLKPRSPRWCRLSALGPRAAHDPGYGARSYLRSFDKVLYYRPKC